MASFFMMHAPALRSLSYQQKWIRSVSMVHLLPEPADTWHQFSLPTAHRSMAAMSDEAELRLGNANVHLWPTSAGHSPADVLL